jgi:hypothetical protein
MNEVIQFWPQVGMILLSLVCIGESVYKNGQEIKLEYTPKTITISVLQLLFLIQGDFKFVSWTGLVWAFFWIVGTVAILKKESYTYSSSKYIFATIIAHAIYLWGGFYDCF